MNREHQSEKGAGQKEGVKKNEEAPLVETLFICKRFYQNPCFGKFEDYSKKKMVIIVAVNTQMLDKTRILNCYSCFMSCWLNSI